MHLLQLSRRLDLSRFRNRYVTYKLRRISLTGLLLQQALLFRQLSTLESHSVLKTQKFDAKLFHTPSLWKPPIICPGCGALSQKKDDQLPGYYPLKPEKEAEIIWGGFKKSNVPRRSTRESDDEVWKVGLERISSDRDLIRDLGAIDIIQPCTNTGRIPPNKQPAPPICRRCHNIKYSHKAPPLRSYPTLDTLATLIMSSPHKNHHIYHMIDATDFPLSLNRKIKDHLHKTLPNRITHNLSISYVITRCDVLMVERKQISSLMTYVKSILKERIPREKIEGSESTNTKIHIVSARRGWDIGNLKEEIKERVGGVWFLGAVNVGKTSILRDVWPQTAKFEQGSLRDTATPKIPPDEKNSLDGFEKSKGKEPSANENLSNAHVNYNPLLPRVSPTISDVPGTTAAPIRISYGRGENITELVDLPGLERWGNGGLLKYVQEKKRRLIQLKERIKAAQYTILPGQSMLIGGLFMVTPKTNKIPVIVNPFTTLPIHIAATFKCYSFMSNKPPEKGRMQDKFYQDWSQLGAKKIGSTIFRGDTDMGSWQSKMSSAGIYEIIEDVTIKRNPMLPTTSEEYLKELPYKVLGTDILLDGIGWLEITAQVRNRRDIGFSTVKMEIFSPEGKGVGQRKPMNAYVILKKSAKLQGRNKKAVRPKPSKKGSKRNTSI